MNTFLAMDDIPENNRAMENLQEVRNARDRTGQIGIRKYMEKPFDKSGLRQHSSKHSI